MASIILPSDFRQQAQFRRPLYAKDGKPVFGIKTAPGDSVPKTLLGAGIAKGSTNAIRYDYYGPQFAVKNGVLDVWNEDREVENETIVCRAVSRIKYSDSGKNYNSISACKDWISAKTSEIYDLIAEDTKERTLAEVWNAGQNVAFQTPTSTIYDGEGPFDRYFATESAAYLLSLCSRVEIEMISRPSPGVYHPNVDISYNNEQWGIVLCFPTCEAGAKLILSLKVNVQASAQRNDESENLVYSPESQTAPIANIIAIPLDGEWTNEIDGARRVLPNQATITTVQAASTVNPTPWGYVDAKIEIVVPPSRAVLITADVSSALENAWGIIENFAGMETSRHPFYRRRFAFASVYLWTERPYSRDTTFARPVAP